MPLSSENAETEAVARALGHRTDASVTGAITSAVHRQLDDLDAADGHQGAVRLDAIRRISIDAAARWPGRPAGDDPSGWLYDERGLPA